MMKVIGPALGGALIAWVGAAENFFVQAVAYAGVLWMIYRMNVPPQRAEARHTSALANLKEGFAYVWSTPAVFALMALGRWMLRRVRLSPPRPQFWGLLRLLPAYAIGGTAMFWLIERLAAF